MATECLFEYFFKVHFKFLQTINGIKTFFNTNFLHFLLRLIIEIGMMTPWITNVIIVGNKKNTELLCRVPCPKVCKIFLTIICQGTINKQGYQIFGIIMTSSTELSRYSWISKKQKQRIDNTPPFPCPKYL